MSNQQPKLDTPLKLKDIEDIANAFKKAKEANPNLIPPGEHWQDNLSIDYYHGMLCSFNQCIRGLLNYEKNPDATISDLINEFNLISGQLAVKIVDKTPKIIMP